MIRMWFWNSWIKVAVSVQCLNIFQLIFFSLSASILYTVKSSAQHETPIPLNFIEQLNKNVWSSKKKTKLKNEHKEQFCKPCCGSMQGYLGAYGALLTALVQASSSQHIIHKEITTGDHLLSCVAGITAPVYVCTTQAGIRKPSMCPKLGLHRKKLICWFHCWGCQRNCQSSWFVHDFCHGNVLWQWIGLRLLSPNLYA